MEKLEFSMFKKVELWVVILVFLIGIIFTIFFASIVRHAVLGGERFPKLQKIAIFFAEIPSNTKKIIQGKNNPLSAYSISTDEPLRNSDVEQINGFVKYEDSNVNSLLLISRYDGNIEKFVIELVDLINFKILNKWVIDTDLIDKKKTPSIFDPFLAKNRYSGVHPLIKKNGDIVFSPPLTILDFCGNIKTINNKYFFHHSNNIDHEGNIWAISKYFPTTLGPTISGTGFYSFEEDGLTKVSKDLKTILFRKSLVEILTENELSNFLYRYDYEWDPLHLNDIQPVISDGKYWKKGDLFLSLRNISAIILYRPSTNKVIEIISGPIKHQHDVDIISDHEISIFNNNVIGTAKKKNKYMYSGYNEVLIYNFNNRTFKKKFNESLLNLKVDSPTGGVQEILRDSSMLLEETDNGKLHFIDSEGKPKWTFYNQAKNQKLYIMNWSRIIEDEELIKSLREIAYEQKCKN